MKKVFALKLFLITLLIFKLSAGSLHVESYVVDTNTSRIDWFAEKVGGKHNGTISFSGGELLNNHGKISGFVEIDMTTIKNVDIDDEKSKLKLETHLKSPDFFDSGKFPKSKFVIKSIAPHKDSLDPKVTHKVVGDLTIKDKTNEIMFNATVGMTHDGITCTGSTIIDRTNYDIKYGSKKFFKDIGDKMIHDEFKIVFNLMAVPKK